MSAVLANEVIACSVHLSLHDDFDMVWDIVGCGRTDSATCFSTALNLPVSYLHTKSEQVSTGLLIEPCKAVNT